MHTQFEPTNNSLSSTSLIMIDFGTLIALKQTINGFLTVEIPLFEEDLQKKVLGPLMNLLDVFTAPDLLIKKRQRKLLDYNRCRDLELKKEKVIYFCHFS